ncbi:hypothetical protein [Actinoplanes awajinensis]|uniref:Uncharacterized protein n=1 Tax=Actinoplanes awajinensis subsp. mycoplanecinus TaxID=135947 RepID=A0A101JJM1_9ACTN|nr:hypothetical protein [Actinoplanes awajinensis]KUL28018.1 hypothetical protein ADL15_32955 [Actinoplanes awajinensis subsp. mycoplanecinus]
MAPELGWDDVQELFDPYSMGSLPDLCVPGTTARDWQALLDLVVASGWRFEYSEGDTVVPLPAAATALVRDPDEECPDLRVWPAAGMLMIFRFWSAEEIDFDVDLREIQGQERLDEFCAFLRAVGGHLGKPVLMSHEGGNPAQHPLLGYSPETGQVTVLTPPLVS